MAAEAVVANISGVATTTAKAAMILRIQDSIKHVFSKTLYQRQVGQAY
jgi:hypothetical protein